MFVVIVLLLAMFIAIGFVVVLVARGAKASSGKPLTALAATLGVPDANPLVVERVGREFTMQVFPGGKNTPPTLRVTTPVDEGGEAAAGTPYREGGREHVDRRPCIVLRRETSNDRIGKRIGMNREVQTGDAGFDAEVYVESDSPDDDIRRTLASEVARAAVRAAIGSGMHRIVLDDKGLSGTMGASPSAERFDQATQHLATIAGALPTFTTGRVTAPRSIAPPLLWLTVSSFVLPLSFFFFGYAPIGTAARPLGVGGGVALAVVAIGIAALVMRKRSDALRRFGMVAMGIVLSVPVGWYSLTVWANRALDRSDAWPHTTVITEKWTTKPKSTTYYHLRVRSWRPGEDTLPLSVSRSFSTSAAVGQGIVVNTHRGWLGWEWVDTFSLVKPPSA